MLKIIPFILILVFSFPAKADIDLKPISPDEPAEYTYNKRFSTENSLECLNQIRSALESYRKITELSNGKIDKETLKKIGNTGWETQNLGFTNWSGSIEGTLKKNEYIIKKLQYELAAEKFKFGQTKESELKQFKDEYKQAEEKFKQFWNSFGVSD